MGKLVLVIIGIVLGLTVLAVWCCILMAGRCSREEEKTKQLKPCPVCHKVPHLCYCCGEYYVSGDNPDCPGCGTAFTEMHSSPELEIEAWNRRAEDGSLSANPS